MHSSLETSYTSLEKIHREWLKVDAKIRALIFHNDYTTMSELQQRKNKQKIKIAGSIYVRI